MEAILENNPFVVFKIPGCKNCLKMTDLFDSLGLQSKYSVINIAEIGDVDYDDIVIFLKQITNSKMFPMIFVRGKYIGSYNEVKDQIELGFLYDILKKELNIEVDIDV
jgi:glutaredoxin